MLRWVVESDARSWLAGRPSLLRFPDLPRPAEILRSFDYSAAYRRNESQADKRFRNKILLVTGLVTGVRHAGAGPVITLPGEGFLEVQAQFADDAADIAARLMPGDAVQLVCGGFGMHNGAVQLAVCRPLASLSADGRQQADALIDRWFAGGAPPLLADGTSAASRLFAFYTAAVMAPDMDPCRDQMRGYCWNHLLAALDWRNGVSRQQIAALHDQAAPLLHLPPLPPPALTD